MKFGELLKLNKDAMLPDMERVRKRTLNRRKNKINAIIIGCSSLMVAAIVVSAIFLFGAQKTAEIPTVVTGSVNVIESVVASSQSELGMKVNSTLKITTTENVSEGELAARLSITPKVGYKVYKTDECKYELRFDDQLEKNALYNLQAVYNGKVVYRWAFQTENVFSITGVYPENESHVSAEYPIEVTFSHSDVTGFEDAFEITPEVKGTFEHYGRTWAFIPSEPMKPATLYTVTVKKGVSGPGDMVLSEDKTFSFSTTPTGSYAYMIYQKNEAADTFLVNEAPIAAICFENVDPSSANVKVFSFADHKAYIDAYKKFVRNGEVSPEIVTMGGTLHQQFNVTPALTSNYNYAYSNAAFINYPDPLPLGYYYAEIEFGGRKLYQLLESTTLSVYTIATNGDYTVWVNDTETGRPVSGAVVSLEGFKDQKTTSLGLSVFENADDSMDGRVMVIENGNYPYVVVLNGEAVDRDVEQRNNYYSYISTNAKLYKPGDTVKVFGTILPRKKDAKTPSEIQLRSDHLDTEMTVKVSKNGYFSADIPLNNTALSYGNVFIYYKETELTGTYFSVAEYELPTYHLSISTDKTAYKLGEEILVTAQVTYMDGTPAAGVPVDFYSELSGGITDENGCVTGTMIASQYGGSYITDKNYPEVHSVSCEVTGGTDAFYGDSTEFIVFKSDVFIESSYSDGKLSVRLRDVDESKTASIDQDRIYSDIYDDRYFAGEAVSGQLVGELHEITYSREPNGTTYDAINKKVVYSWTYKENDAVLRTFDLFVTDGVGEIILDEKPDENRNYYVVLRLLGDEENSVVQCYLSDYNYTGGNYKTFNMVADKTILDFDETVEFLVRDGRDNEAVNSGSVLYTAASGELLGNYYSDSARCSIEFKKDFAPDVFVYGAYFDGKHVYSLGYEQLNYEIERSKLNIEMEQDKTEYQPGDEVTLSFKVTDSDGNPVSALLNVSVIDRALYLISGEFNDPLYQLYGSRCYATTVYTTCSHREFMRGDLLGGEGGGGEGEWRDDFEDTPFFETVNTDSDGKATITFTLPDSITEWKVIARAISTDVQAGMKNFSIRSTQDFFTHVSMSDTLKITDDFTVALKGEGSSVGKDSVCEFNVGITDRDGNELKTLQATAEKSQYVYLNFGKMEEGLYTVYIQAKNGALEDNVIRTFNVEKSSASVWIHHQQPIAGSLDLSLVPQRGNVTLTIVDEQQSFWLSAMARLRNSAGNRVDQVLGQYLADQFYSTGKWMDPEKMDYSVIRSYMGYDGVSLMADSDGSDLRVTAKLAAVAPDFCEIDSLRSAFDQYMNNRYASRVDVVISYFGLAALGEPVLADLQAFYRSQTDLTPEETAYLALSFAYCGDYSTAHSIYEANLKALLMVEGDKAYAMVNGKVDEDLTGCLALLSNRLNLECSEGLINYILETDTKYTLLSLELISYLSDRVHELAGMNTVTVSTADGRNESYSYQKMGALVLNLSPAQASKIRIINVEGSSVVSYAYNGSVEDLQMLGEKSPIGMELPSDLRVGQLSSIIIYVDIPSDFELPSLDITLPVGVRFDSGRVSAGSAKYSIYDRYNSDIIHAPLQSGSNTITLNLRGALPGNYELEPITVTNSRDNRFMATDSVSIQVAE